MNVCVECFFGKCPYGFACLPNDACCENENIVLPPESCKDFLDHCESAICDHTDFVDFAQANCAKTCNMCFANSTLPPEYACSDILDDCKERTRLCRDIDYMDIMAIFCPRTCLLCTHPVKDGQCGEALDDCASRDKFCKSTKISTYQKTNGCGKTCGFC